jgi:signal transduction histidine kinase
MKIRAHLSLILAAALVPIVVFSGMAVNLVLDAEKVAALNGLQETARATALSVDRELASAEAALRVLATSKNLDDDDLSGFYLQAKAADRGVGAWTVLFDAEGRQLVNTAVPFGTALPQNDARERIASVFATQKTLVSDLQTTPLMKQPVTTLNIPVVTASGKHFMLAETFGANYFFRVFMESKTAPEWTMAVIDRSGRFITRSRATNTMGGRPARPELVAAARAADRGYLRHLTWENVDSYDVFTHSKLSGWTIAIAAPAVSVDAAATNALRIAVGGMVAALLLAIAVAAWFSRQLVQAIDAADHAARALVKGDPPQPIDSSVEEINRLSHSLQNAGELLAAERVSRHLAELERERLLGNEQQARAGAEAANLGKDKFMAMLGHELRNPLSAISGAIALARSGKATPKMRTHAEEVIERQSAHLNHIVNDLLEHSRVTLGKIRINLTPVDLAVVVVGCMDALRSTRRNDTVKLHVSVEPAWIDGDFPRIEQIVNNLIGNALKFTRDGGRIEVGVRARTEEGVAMLIVRDSGIGISEALMAHLFEPFVQGEARLNHVQGGLGIGLNLVRQLVELHGGAIEVCSEGEERGATFTVRFPLCAAPPEGSSVSRRASPVMDGTVLLIEDNDDAREMMSALLDAQGLNVLEAATGLEGVRLAREHRPAYAVVDVGLPDISGYEVASQLRADNATRGMRLIALTGYGQADDVRKALEHGFDAHFAKPVMIEQLLAAMGAPHG